MKKHMIKKISILMAALLLLVCLPMTAQAGKGSSHGRATPSNMEREEEIEEPEDEAGEETEDVMVSETGEPEEELTVLEEETEAAEAAAGSEAPKAQTAIITEEDIAGTWTIDGVTNYQFKEGGTGALLLPEHKYAFDYTLEEDGLSLKFESAKVKKAVFRVSFEGGDLILTKEGEAGTTEYLLTKTKD